MGSWACKSGSPKMDCLPTRVRLRASPGQPLKFMERLSALLRKHARILMRIIGVVQEDKAGSGVSSDRVSPAVKGGYHRIGSMSHKAVACAAGKSRQRKERR